ncbi:MAG TPA: GntR family transcriptional regulator [bacterium]|nr:GntR family transcriptional regulator [bacterium]
MPRFSTIQEAITRDLREEIVAGRLAPATRLVVEELATKFDVSPMPVREALRHLAAEGLVAIHSYRGATVAELSIEEIREIFLLRRLLEGEAAALGARALGADDRARLRALMDGMRGAVRDHGRWITADRAFHMTVYRASGSVRLVNLVERLRQDIERYVRLYIAAELNIPRSMRRHEEILAACLAGDGATARRVTVVHLRETAEIFIAELERAQSGSIGIARGEPARTPALAGRAPARRAGS